MEPRAIRFVDSVTSVMRHCLSSEMDERQEREPDEAIGLGAHLLYIFLELNTFLPIENEFLILGTSEFTWMQGFRMVNKAVQRERNAVECMLSTRSPFVWLQENPHVMTQKKTKCSMTYANGCTFSTSFYTIFGSNIYKNLECCMQD